jgi:ribonucleoside-diphosphate reductase alpha chain
LSFTREEVFEATKNYFNGDDLAANAFFKYALSDKEKYFELTPDDMHKRLASELSRVEGKYPNPMSEEEIYELLAEFKFIVPQGSPMSAMGNPYQIQSLSNCYVIDSPYDSYAGILTSDQEMVQIMKRRGGVGFDLSTIRPRGQLTSNAAKTTDGIGVFMDRFSNSCREVAQGGRRGALMLTIDCRHPEIMTFINIKRDLKRVTGANISVRFNDEFMHAVEGNEEFCLRWPVECSPEDAKITQIVNAQEVWNAFIDSAWNSAEPGALFWDTVLNNTPADCYQDKGYKTVSTNPCGELVLSPYDSCRLLVVNLLSLVSNPFTSEAKFDWEKFNDIARKAQRLMDDIIDLEMEAIDKIINKIVSDEEPESVKAVELNLWKKIKAATFGGRRTGLGITALGDALAALGIQYGSEKSVQVTESIYKDLALAAYTETVNLAKERGSFPVYDYELEKDHSFINQIMDAAGNTLREDWQKYGRRNIALTTTAPVGTVSMLTQTTSGIEPAFLLEYKRRKKIISADEKVDFVDDLGDKWQEFDVYHHGYKQWMDITGNESKPELSPYWKATSNDVDWVKSVDIQAAAQKWVCHSISKTCNIPNSTPKSVVNDVYMRAWKTGCKGFTVYRDGSRSGVLISKDDSNKNKFQQRNAPKRPKTLKCDIHHATIQGEKWTLLVGLMEEKPYEILGGLSKYVEIPKKYDTGVITKHQRKTMVSKYDLHVGEDNSFVIRDIAQVFDNPNHSAFTRTISLSLRHGVPIQYLVEQLQKDKDFDMFSFAKCISRVLKKYIKDGTKGGNGTMDCCANPNPIYQEGCLTCMNCGSSKCG